VRRAALRGLPGCDAHSPRKTKIKLQETKTNRGQSRWVSDARRARRKREGRRRTAGATETTTTSLACVSEWCERRVTPRKVKIRQHRRSAPVKTGKNIWSARFCSLYLYFWRSSFRVLVGRSLFLHWPNPVGECRQMARRYQCDVLAPYKNPVVWVFIYDTGA